MPHNFNQIIEIMDFLLIEIQIAVNTPPTLDRNKLIDRLTDYIYDYYRDGADVQSVYTVKINGEEIDQ